MKEQIEHNEQIIETLNKSLQEKDRGTGRTQEESCGRSSNKKTKHYMPKKSIRLNHYRI